MLRAACRIATFIVAERTLTVIGPAATVSCHPFAVLGTVGTAAPEVHPRSHAALTGSRHAHSMQLSPISAIVVAIAVGVAGAVAVVIFDSVIADVIGGALGLAGLAVVIRSTIRLAGEVPGDDTASQQP